MDELLLELIVVVILLVAYWVVNRKFPEDKD